MLDACPRKRALRLDSFNRGGISTGLAASLRLPHAFSLQTAARRTHWRVRLASTCCAPSTSGTCWACAYTLCGAVLGLAPRYREPAVQCAVGVLRSATKEHTQRTITHAGATASAFWPLGSGCAERCGWTKRPQDLPTRVVGPLVATHECTQRWSEPRQRHPRYVTPKLLAPAIQPCSVQP